MKFRFSENPYTMRSSAISYSYDQIYALSNSQSYYLDQYDYKNFTKTIEQIFLENKNYCEYSKQK